MSEAVRHPRVGIGVFVFRDGKFLIGRRKGSHASETWSIPGGHLEFNETPEETAVREVKEETNCDITNIRFGALTNDRFYDEEKHYISIWLISDWQAGENKVMEPDKCLEQRWVDFETLPEPLSLWWDNLRMGEFYDKVKSELKQSKKGAEYEV